MSTTTQTHRFSADTSKLAYAQAFTGNAARHGNAPAPVRHRHAIRLIRGRAGR